jgi:hypothetical protein
MSPFLTPEEFEGLEVRRERPDEFMNNPPSRVLHSGGVIDSYVPPIDLSSRVGGFMAKRETGDVDRPARSCRRHSQGSLQRVGSPSKPTQGITWLKELALNH